MKPNARNFRTKVLAALAVLALGLVTVTAAAKPPRGPFGGGQGAGGDFVPGRVLERIAQRLDLTDEQKAEIRDILLSHKEELQAELQAVKQARRAQFDAIHAETFNETAIRAAAAAVGAAETELAVTRGVIAAEVRQVLTPEQLAELAKLREDARSLVESMLETVRARFELMG